MTPEELNKINDEAIRKAELEKLEPIDFDTLQEKVKEWMLIDDFGVVKFLCMVYIGNHLARDPVWALLIGPSGGGKTELLGGLLDLPDIYSISLLTSQTFLSGMPGKGDASLLPKINGKTVIFKDWTNILSMNKDARAEIMGQLREIYDGHMKKPFGNNKIAEWKGKIGIIAGTTPVVDLAQQMHATLGERFIHYRVKMPGRKEVGRISLNNSSRQKEMRKELQNAFYAFFKNFDMQQDVKELSDEVKDEIVRVADFASMARSGVIREFSFKKEIVFVPAVEMPTRIVQQLTTLAHSAMVVNGGEYLEEDMRIIYKIALDSIPQTNRMVCLEMAREDNRSTADIATSLGYPTSPIHMYLENLNMLGVCERTKGGNADTWTLNSEFVDILKTYEEVEDMPEKIEENQEELMDEANKALAQEEGPQQDNLI